LSTQIMSVGEKIREARKRGGYTLKEVGSRIGVAHSSLSQIETGTNQPSKQILISLARVLGDNFGLDWLTEHVDGAAPTPSKKEIARELSVQELISLKFGGGGETRTRAQLRALAQLLDAEIEKEQRIMSYPVRKR